MTILQIQQHQRLRSDEERQAYEAVARARVAQLDREAAARKTRIWWWVSAVAILVLGVAVLVHEWRVGRAATEKGEAKIFQIGER